MGMYRSARVAEHPTPIARYACRPNTARPQVDPGCLRICRTRQTGGDASNSAVGISNTGISPLPPKLPLPVDGSPNPTTCLIPGPVRSTMPNGIRIRSTVFHNALDKQTDTQTAYRLLTGMVCNYSPLMLHRQQCGLIIITNLNVITW